MKYRLRIQNEILYIFIILAVTQFFNYSILKTPLYFLVTLGSLGLLVLETWFVRVFSMYSARKISKFSDVLVKISLKERFFAYFVLPAVFYISLLVFLYFNRNELLGYTVMGVSMMLLLVLFLNVKSSLNKIYSMAIATRAVFDFICITIFYLLLNSFLRIGLSMEYFALATVVSAFILLIFVLKIHDRVGFLEIMISILSALFISLFSIFFWNHNVFTIPAIGSLLFYLVISIWNIRFSGKIKFVDYLWPFLYVVLAIILILNL